MRFRLSGLLTLLLSSLAAAQFPEGFVELRTVDALTSRLSQAHVVALGEPTPGTHGFSDFELRVVQQLVEQHGFRALLPEYTSDDRAFARYFETCEPAALLWALYRNQWQENHVGRVALYSWLCTYNRAHPDDPVRVVAFYPEKPWHDVPTLVDFAKVAASADFTRALEGIRSNCLAASLGDQLEQLDSQQMKTFFREKKLDAGEDARCLAALTSGKKVLRRPNDALRERTGPLRFGDAQRAIDNITVWQAVYRDSAHGRVHNAELEDRMLDNVLWFLSSRGNPKTIIIADVVHVAKTPVPRASPDKGRWNGLVSMGTRLDRELGQQYAAVALTSSKVSSMFGVISPELKGPTSLDAMVDSMRRPGDATPVWVDTAAPLLGRRATWAIHDASTPVGRAYLLPKAFDAVVSFRSVETAIALGPPSAEVRDGGR